MITYILTNGNWLDERVYGKLGWKRKTLFSKKDENGYRYQQEVFWKRFKNIKASLLEVERTMNIDLTEDNTRYKFRFSTIKYNSIFEYESGTDLLKYLFKRAPVTFRQALIELNKRPCRKKVARR